MARNNYSEIQHDINNPYNVEKRVYEIEKLYAACAIGDLEMVKYIISTSIKADGVDLVNYLKAALYKATKHEHMNVIKYLVEEHSVNNLNEAMICACETDNMEIITYFVGLGANDFTGGLYNACFYGHMNVVKYLIEEKNTVPDSESLRIASNFGCVEVVKYLANKYLFGMEVIHKCTQDACYYGHYKIVKTMIEDFGAGCLNTYLVFALYNTNIDLIKYLIEKGADNVDIIADDKITLLLNNGVSYEKLKDKGKKAKEIRDNINLLIADIVLSNTNLCKDVVDVICSYNEYIELPNSDMA